jgi:ribonuclease VapC
VIAVDTSALMAILLQEPGWEARSNALRSETEILISAGTLAEALIVAGRRNIREEMEALIERFAFNIVPLSVAAARRVAAAYEKWGKGTHPAGLTFGDCFANEVAKAHDCALLYVGDDFSKTDVKRAL